MARRLRLKEKEQEKLKEKEEELVKEQNDIKEIDNENKKKQLCKKMVKKVNFGVLLINVFCFTILCSSFVLFLDYLCSYWFKTWSQIAGIVYYWCIYNDINIKGGNRHDWIIRGTHFNCWESQCIKCGGSNHTQKKKESQTVSFSQRIMGKRTCTKYWLTT